jgi:hypothetical protein
MSTTIIPIKAFLGKYYPELLYSASQDKYKNTGLDNFFEQRFYIQNNKVQMIVDPSITGMVVVVEGNEIHVSKELYDHPSVVVVNSLESNQQTNPRNLYNPETFSTLAYLVCQNHTTFQIVGEIDEPIYVRYRADYETFYSSVIVFNISNEVEVEIVEEIESYSALNAVTNYILYPGAKLNLTTFYQNHLSAISFCYRNIIVQDGASYSHMMFGKGSSNVIDENKIHTASGSSSELLGVINSDGMDFHSILYVEPAAPDYKIAVDYRDVLEGKSSVTFFPVILGQSPGADLATIEVSNITIEEIPSEKVVLEVKEYLSDIVDRATLVRMTGVERFYNNKTKFLHFP